MSTLSNIRAIEQQLSEAKQEFADGVSARIASLSLPGVQAVSDNIALVCLSDLDNGCLGPERYLARPQAEAVRKSIQKSSDTEAAVKKIVADQAAGTTRLHSAVIETLSSAIDE